jgi:hypothetical protein
LFELAGKSEEEQLAKLKDRPTGMFEGLLMSEPNVLFNDLLRHPKKYEPGVQHLLQLLISGHDPTNLHQQDRELLDRATIDFAQPYREPPEEKPPPKKEETVDDHLDSIGLIGGSDPEPDGGGEGFGWL